MRNEFITFLQESGLEYRYLLNGFIGSLVWSLYKKLRFAEALRQILIGSLVAGYVTPLVAFKESIPVENMAALSFVVGMMGMVIIDSTYKYIINRVKELKKGREVLLQEVTEKDA